MIIDTQARLFAPAVALSLGLIDEIAPAQEAIDSIAQRYAQTPASSGRRIGARARAIDTTCQL